MQENLESATLSRVHGIRPEIEEICRIAGTAGASIGVIHQGRVLHTAAYGRRDAGTNEAPDSRTMYGIGSMTKAFVAAGICRLVDEGKLDWTTPIKSIISEWNNVDPLVTNLTTITDCLAHRTGLPGNYEMTFQGDGDNLLPKDQLMPLLNSMELATSFRSQWRYSSWGYAVAQLVIERLSGQTLEDFLRETIYRPLGMQSTTTQPMINSEDNVASPHSTLSDGSTYPLEKHMEFKNTFLEGAAGAYTNVDDMLIWAKAMFAASNRTNTHLKGIDLITSSHVPVLPPSLRERSYGMGWVRTQLPGVVGVMGDNVGLLPLEQLPELGRRSPSMLLIYHQGSTMGYYSSIFLFPETKSAIVVLTNSIALCDTADLVG